METLKIIGVTLFSIAGICSLIALLIALKNHYGWFESKHKLSQKNWREKYYSTK
jgi:hypothetical protein